jgi:aspartyl-tRNA(Asn)/glutamyl-tRNA(Gln) amidotransferase subunit A
MHGIRIGIPKELRQLVATSDADRIWRSAESLLTTLGIDVVEVSLPSIRHSLPAYYLIALSEASSNLARYDGVRYGYRAENCHNIEELFKKTRALGFGQEVKRRIMLGTFALSAGYYDQYYLKAQKVRRIIADEFSRAFNDVDALIWPTTPSGAFELGTHSKDPADMYAEDVFTVPINLAGLPAISIPICRSDDGLPLGLQVIGPRLSDDVVLQIADVLEKQAGFADPSMSNDRHMTSRFAP